MASIGLKGQNEYAYWTNNSILWGAFETKFCFKSYGLGVKVEHTDRQTDSFQLYIYRYSGTLTYRSPFCPLDIHLKSKGGNYRNALIFLTNTKT